jgi:hypothetical protein
MILLACLWGDSPARRRLVTVSTGTRAVTITGVRRTQLNCLGVTPLPSLLPILWIVK